MQTIQAFSAQESWRQTHFGTTANSGTAADTFDADKDGLANLVEYAFALNPTISTGPSQLPQPQRTANDFTLTFNQPGGVAGASYSLTLAPGSWISIPDTGTNGTHLFSVAINGEKKMFVRLEVVASP